MLIFKSIPGRDSSLSPVETWGKSRLSACVFAKAPQGAMAEILSDALKENQCEGLLRLIVGLTRDGPADQLSSEAPLLDGERLHQLRPAAVGVEQVQLPAAVAPDLRRPDARRVAHTLARRLQRFLNVGHEQRDVMHGT